MSDNTNEKKSKSWIVWLILALSLLAIPVGLFSRSEHKSGETEEASAWSMLKKDKIKVIRLDGMIMDQGRESILSLPRGASVAIKNLRKARDDKRVKGVLIRINSPGGTVGASQELNQAVLELRKEKPVIATMGDLAASGGYYVACACDRIYANPGTLTGSIGVIMSGFNLKGLTEKLGVEPKVVKSGPFKDLTSMYRPMSEAEREILQGLIDDSYDQFVTAVAQGRKMDKEAVKKLADGRIYSGRQALKNGLVDKLGSYEDALNDLQSTCKKKYGLKKELKVDDDNSDSFLESLFDTSSKITGFPSASSASMFDEVLPMTMRARFYNQPLWMMP